MKTTRTVSASPKAVTAAPLGALNGSGRIPHRCLIKLRAIYPTLRSAERGGADFLLAHPDEVANLGVVEFAARAGCSEAPVVRLSRKLGYSGFPELKKDFAEFEPLQTYRDITRNDGPETVARKVFANSVQALTDTLDTLDWTAYGRAVEALVQAKRLAFLGLGNAGMVAREVGYKFLRLGVPSYSAEDPDLQLIIVHTQLARGDLLIAISYSGESKPILAAARQARARGILVLAVINFPRSPLARQADVVLLTAVFQSSDAMAAQRIVRTALLGG